MRPKLLLLALCAGVILGQYEPTLVGLPEYGVTLSGPANNPEIVNNSGRAILGYVIWSCDATGVGPEMPALKTRELRLALVRPTSGSAPTAVPPQSNLSNVGAIVGANLEAVIFSDGQFVGPDHGHTFALLSARIDGERSLAQSVSDKHMSWEELQALFEQLKETRPVGGPEVSARHATQMMLAGDLISIRRAYGEAAALTIADWSSKLPVLWRAQ